MTRSALLALAALAFVAVGCASAPAPRVVRSADLGTMAPLAPHQPLVIAFAAGDKIPLVFQVDGPFVKSAEAAPPIDLVVARPFFLKIDDDGLHASPDGLRFGERPVQPGQFRVGLSASKSGGVEARVDLRTPVPAGMPPMPPSERVR